MATWRKATGTVTSNGIPIANVTVYVYEKGTTTYANIYSDEGVTPIDQAVSPILTDAAGRYAFYLDVEAYPQFKIFLDPSSAAEGYDFDLVNEDLDGISMPAVGPQGPPGGGADTFLELTDTPSSYTGAGGNVVLVKPTEDGIEISPWPVSGTLLNFFLSDNSADIGSYYYMYPTETGGAYSELTSPSLATGDDQLLWSFITEAGEPGVDLLALGAYTATAFLTKTGNKDVRVYWKLFKRDASGTETEILQSAVSDYLTLDNRQYLVSAYLNEDGVLETTDRLVFKLYANVSGTGTDVTVTLTMEGDYDSRIMINILTSAFTLDRLSDTTIASPANDEVLAYDSSSGDWINQTPSEAGILAADGSVPLTGDLNADGHSLNNLLSLLSPLTMEGSLLGKVDDNAVREFGRLGCSLSGYDNRGAGYILPGAWDRMLFLDKKGGSISATTAPAHGALSYLVNGKGSKVYWLATDLPVTITFTLEEEYFYCRDFFIHWYPGYAPKEFKVRFKKSDGTLLTEVHKTDWNPAWGTFVITVEDTTRYNTKTIEIELIQAKDGYDYAHMFEVIWLYPEGATVFEPALYRGGGDMWGNIDMNGNGIDGLNVINPTSGNVGIGTTSPGGGTTAGEHVLSLKDVTNVPAGGVSGQVSLYSSGGELYAFDSAGNATVLSPHRFELFEPDPSYEFPFSYYSENRFIGKKINVDMYGAIRALEQLSGKQFIFTEDLPADEVIDWDENEELQQIGREKEIEEWKKRKAEHDKAVAEYEKLPEEEREEAMLPEPPGEQPEAYVKRTPPRWMVERLPKLEAK